MNRKLILLIFLSILLSVFLLPSSVMAAKKRVRTTAGAGKATGVSYSSAKLSRATNSVVVTFLNLSQVKRVEYTLSYSAKGISQGVVGSFFPSGQSSNSRDLYFGTCSKGVCTAHYNIRGASLVVTTTITSGAVSSKRYIIRI